MAVLPAEPTLRIAVDRLWQAVGELVLTVHEDRPRAVDLAVVDDFAEQVLELQAGVAAARQLLLDPAGCPASRLPEVSVQLHETSNHYWRRLRAHGPVAELRRAAHRLRGELPGWLRSVDTGVQRCEEPLAACADAVHQCWRELCLRLPEPVEPLGPVTAANPRRSA